MLNHSKQQQSVILKGIAQQLLTMQMPTFEEAEKLLINFNLHLITDGDLSRQHIFDMLSANLNEETIFCYECEGPAGESLIYKIPMSWNSRTPELIEKLIKLDFEKVNAMSTTDPEIAKLWPDEACYDLMKVM